MEKNNFLNEGRTVGPPALTLETIAAKYAIGELKFDSTKLAEKLLADGNLREDPLTRRLFDAYHELKSLHEQVHLLQLKLSQIRGCLTADIPAQASVIAALSILNDVSVSESASVDVEPTTKRSV